MKKAGRFFKSQFMTVVTLALVAAAVSTSPLQSQQSALEYDPQVNLTKDLGNFSGDLVFLTILAASAAVLVLSLNRIYEILALIVHVTTMALYFYLIPSDGFPLEDSIALLVLLWGVLAGLVYHKYMKVD